MLVEVRGIPFSRLILGSYPDGTSLPSYDMPLLKSIITIFISFGVAFRSTPNIS
jgi:hypothetical protein